MSISASIVSEDENGIELLNNFSLSRRSLQRAVHYNAAEFIASLLFGELKIVTNERCQHGNLPP